MEDDPKKEEVKAQSSKGLLSKVSTPWIMVGLTLIGLMGGFVGGLTAGAFQRGAVTAKVSNLESDNEKQKTLNLDRENRLSALEEKCVDYTRTLDTHAKDIEDLKKMRIDIGIIMAAIVDIRGYMKDKK
jgi:hypothetical protein